MISEVQVGRFHTALIVAPMEDKETVGNWAIMQFPREAVNPKQAFAPTPSLYNSVSGFFDRATPFPATISRCSGYLLPKSHFGRRKDVFPHDQ